MTGKPKPAARAPRDVPAKKAASKRPAKGRPAMRQVGTVNKPGYRANLRADKYTAMEKILLAVLPRKAPGLTQAEMFDAVSKKVDKTVFPGTTYGWWAKGVQLDLEKRGLVSREATKPLRWYRA